MSTSRPGPAALLEVYEQAARDGATAIVSVHLSGDMSGTFESAQLAARDASIPVIPVDTRQVGRRDRVRRPRGRRRRRRRRVGRGRRLGRPGPGRGRVVALLRRHPGVPPSRRPDRCRAAALLGGALSVKPLLQIEDGKVASLEKVRTSARALARLEELAVQAAGEAPVDVCVAHLANPERAGQLTAKLAAPARGEPRRSRGLVRGARRRPRRPRRARHDRGLRLTSRDLSGSPRVVPRHGPGAVVHSAASGRSRAAARFLASGHVVSPSQPRAPGSRLPPARPAQRRARRRPGRRPVIPVTPVTAAVPGRHLDRRSHPDPAGP